MQYILWFGVDITRIPCGDKTLLISPRNRVCIFSSICSNVSKETTTSNEASGKGNFSTEATQKLILSDWYCSHAYSIASSEMSTPTAETAYCASNWVPYPVPQAASSTRFLVTNCCANLYRLICSISNSLSVCPNTRRSPVNSIFSSIIIACFIFASAHMHRTLPVSVHP